jgi:hypothetical protein
LPSLLKSQPPIMLRSIPGATTGAPERAIAVTQENQG